jgi:hypothetical protein
MNKKNFWDGMTLGFAIGTLLTTLMWVYKTEQNTRELNHAFNMELEKLDHAFNMALEKLETDIIQEIKKR